MTRFAFAALAALSALVCATNDTTACTGIRLQAKDGAIVHARTMEFGFQLNSDLIVIPRAYEMHGTTNWGEPGLRWKTKYGATGLNGCHQGVIIDGVNEKGLAGGIFYLPGYAEFQTVTPADQARSIAPWELITWALTNFSTVNEVRAALPEIKVGKVVLDGAGIVPPVHYIVHDAQGNSLVIEYIGGNLAMHDDPIGVITNAPEFEWHLKNLNNYVNLRVTNASPENLDGLKIQQFGQGSGLLGIPGDFTPPSRFVKAAVLSQAAVPGENGEQAVAQAFHVLDSFDIPRGVVRDAASDPSGFELTQWTSASDTRNCVFYFHSYDNRRVRRFDLTKANLDATQIVTFSLQNSEDVEDLTPPINEE